MKTLLGEEGLAKIKKVAADLNVTKNQAQSLLLERNVNMKEKIEKQ